MTRAVAYLLLEDIRRKGETKTKHITVWTHLMRQFYDGIIDDIGRGLIHSNEPYQAVFWTAAHLKQIDVIDRTCGYKDKYKRKTNKAEWTGQKNYYNALHALAPKIENRIYNGRYDEIPENVKNLLNKDNIYDFILKANLGDPSPFTEDKFVDDVISGRIPSGYLKMVLWLFLKNSDKPQQILYDRILSISGIIEDLYSKGGEDLLLLLTHYMIPEESKNSFTRILETIIPNIKNLSDPAILYKIYKKSDVVDGHYSIYTIRELVDSILSLDDQLVKYPKLISILLDLFKSYSSYFKSNQSFSDMGKEVMKLLQKLHVKKLKYWEIFFPLIGFDMEALNTFLNSNTGLEEDFRDYANDSDEYISHRSNLNDIWFRRFGVDLFRPRMSQFDAIRKSRKLKLNPKYKVGDILNYSGSLVEILSIHPTLVHGEVLYDIEDEHGNTDTAYESDLMPYIDKKRVFNYGDYVEDEDGNIWMVETIYPDEDGKIEVWSSAVGYRLKKVSDLVKYDPDTSLHKPKHPIGSIVDIDYPTYGHLHDIKITGYTPYDPRPYEADWDGTLISFKDAWIIDKTQESNMVFKSGNSFLSPDGKNMCIVIEHIPDKKTYHIKYYQSNEGVWKEILDDKNVNEELFRKDITKDGWKQVG